MESIELKDIEKTDDMIFISGKDKNNKSIPKVVMLDGKPFTIAQLQSRLLSTPATTKAKCKFTDKKQKEIVKKFKDGWTITDLATKYKATPRTIKRVFELQSVNYKKVLEDRKND